MNLSTVLLTCVLAAFALQVTGAEEPSLHGMINGTPWTATSARLSHLPGTADVWYVDVYGEALPGKFEEPTKPFLIVPVPKKVSTRTLGDTFNVTRSSPPADNEAFTRGSVATTRIAADAVWFTVTVSADGANHVAGRFSFAPP